MRRALPGQEVGREFAGVAALEASGGDAVPRTQVAQADRVSRLNVLGLFHGRTLAAPAQRAQVRA